MKKIISKSFFILIILSNLILFSCTPFSLDQEFSANDIVGKWRCTELDNNRISYIVTVNLVNDNTITMENFGQLGNDAIPKANVYNSKIVMDEQYVCDNAEWLVEGAGFVVSANKIEMDFTMFDGKTNYEISSVWTRL